MSFLLYGIVHGDRIEPREKLRFLGYPRASIMARTTRLGAIVSKLSPADADPDVARLLIYSKIIESFNHERAVIPMRYGCRFKTIGDIAEFLKREQGPFGALLDELDGRVEMSASVAFDDPRDDRATPPSRLLSSAMPTGMGYLAGRARHYSLVDQSGARREEVRKSLCAMAEGKFMRAIAEHSSHDRKSMLTIHFLVPRAGVAEFSRALLADRRRSIEVSGPWPPYNFVSTKTRALTI
ncbi:MAG: GvpL/GvpF family gas vesicle protein [Candidatus Binatus sp.]|uniref:GvpL/GvpF family gas vesicle protein n=1 Tax=Candidatus Binatus sp. TaxID=2811406 RepID=UPI002721ED4B|nr:GvpL/GvpF family gas vesicle protein [Candidatus Binatus sp.]MDO8433215.1 GvpL/GvpF family gas vesicle protein [Candidatus Binatus sp.]